MSNPADIREWTDEEIINYLKSYWECEDLVFICKLDAQPFKTKNPDKFKGSIRNISYNRKLLCYPDSSFPIFFNISATTRFEFQPGNYKMRFELETRERREQIGNMFMLRPIYGSIRELNEDKLRVAGQRKAEQGKSEHSNAEKELFEWWGVSDCNFIGLYHYDEENDLSTVDDIRKPNFAKIPYYPGDSQKKPIVIHYPHKIKGIVPENYYLFNWKLSGNNYYNPYEIHIDFEFQPQPIRQQWFVEKLFDDRYNDKSKNFESSANFLDTLSKQLSAKESTFIYELLQNANDYPIEGVPVDVEFHITDHYLLFMHSGDYFNVRNISGICGINEKEKSANKKTIGYKGIGFKTVFLNNHYVYIRTGDYSFRFEEGAKKIKRLEAPWPILPIWTDEREVPDEVSSVFNTADPKYRVKIALRPDTPSILHSGRKNYEILFKEIFEDSNLILFIPNIRSVKVYIKNELVRNCVIDENKWLVSDYEEDIDPEFQRLVNKDIDTGKSRIPEKYKDFDRTKVSFACKKDGRKLLPVDDAHLYCYLPTSASWGFPFLLNTDMIPKGDRDDIEREVYLKDEDETNFNLELARIAGEKFFNWIQDLIKCGEYDYDSVFSLIPNFEKCIKGTDEKYEDFIEKFQEGFESKMEGADLVPTLIDKKIVFKPVNKIIFDTTGLSCCGIMTDEEILQYSNWSDYFPHPLLRDYSKCTLLPGIKTFLSTYRLDEQVYDTDVLHSAVEESEFQDWLSKQEKNEKFLGFLLKRKLIEEFSDSAIFLAESGGLNTPDDLFYSVDDYYQDLVALDSYLGRLSLKTRALCEKSKDWEEFKDNFKKFDPDDFVDDILLDDDNEDDVHEILSDAAASFQFMHFLACHVGFSDSYKRFPFIDADGSTIESFEERKLVFAPSKEAVDIRQEEWIDEDWIAVISSSYDEQAQKYFLEKFGVSRFDNKIIIEEIVCDEDCRDSINEHISEYSSSKSFVEFAFTNREFLSDKALESFVVSSIDKEGNESFLAVNEYYIYQRNKTYNEVESQPWLDNELMYALNESYYQKSGEIAAYKTFFTDKFNIPVLTDKLFMEDIVLNNIDSINENLSDDGNNISFWRWTKGFAKESTIIQSFACFDLLVKELDEDEYSICPVKGNGIYLSNAYLPSSNIEAIVKKYAPNALFVASDYLENENVSTIKEWVEFFKSLGVKITIVDLVFGKIIPNISDIKEEGLPNLLGQYYAEIQEKWEERLDNRKSVKSNLKSIFVKTRDGEYTPIQDCIIIDVTKEKEPFPEIKLDKEISDGAASNRNAKKLLLDIAAEADSLVINDVTAWQECKLDEYAGNEQAYSIDTHIHFIEELAAIDTETLKTFESRKQLKLLDSNDEYQTPKDLTLGTQYKTSCLFDKYGITNGLSFLSNRYVAINQDSKVADLAKKVLGVHYRFEKEDIQYLSQYKFAVYFWSEYALKHLEFVENLIEEGELEDAVCVPTLAGNVYEPSEVYSRTIADYVLKKIPGWDDKLPIELISEDGDESKNLLSKLNLREKLSFEDGLNALRTIKSRDKRREILEWMNEDYDDSYSELILEYRNSEDAIWKNGKAEDKHIRELYAIAPDSKTLREFFRDNEFVLHSDYISLLWDDEYRSICKMMQIPIIEENDMSFEPDGVQDSIGRYFEGRLLVVAGVEDADKWKESFEKYKEKISNMTFWHCSSISWTYKGNEKISQSSKKFYAKDSDFYYVKDWCTKQVYTDFVRELYDYLGCTMNEDQFATILDPDEEIQDLLEEYYSLRTDEYIAELAKYDNSYSKYSGPKVTDEIEEEDGVIESSQEYRPIRTPLFTQESDNGENGKMNDENDEIDEVDKTENIEFESSDEDEETNENELSIEEPAVEPHVNVQKEATPSSGQSHKNEFTECNPKSETEEYDSAGSESDFSENEQEPEEEYFEFDPDEGKPIGDVTNDRKNYEPVGIRPREPRQARRKAAKPFTQAEVNRLRSNGTPLELESLPPTDEELDVLSQCGISPEQIADTNYLAQLRLYRNLQKELGEEPEESLAEFIRNADDVAEHKMKSGKYVHACSAARGVMYVSPSVWNKMMDDKWVICVYLDGKGKNFHYINTAEEFLKLVQKDDVVIKITGKEKVDVVNSLYTSLLENVKGTAYTLVRVAARTNMDAVFAHYVGAMAESNDGNEPENLDEY